MNDKTPENRMDALEKKLKESHWAIANVQSKGFSEIYIKMAVHTEILNRIEKTLEDTNKRIDGVNSREDLRNGRLGKLEKSEIKAKTSLGWLKWAGGSLFILLSGLGTYAYFGDIKQTNAKIEIVSNKIESHIEIGDRQFKNILEAIKNIK